MKVYARKMNVSLKDGFYSAIRFYKNSRIVKSAVLNTMTVKGLVLTQENKIMVSFPLEVEILLGKGFDMKEPKTYAFSSYYSLTRSLCEDEIDLVKLFAVGIVGELNGYKLDIDMDGWEKLPEFPYGETTVFNVKNERKTELIRGLDFKQLGKSELEYLIQFPQIDKNSDDLMPLRASQLQGDLFGGEY